MVAGRSGGRARQAQKVRGLKSVGPPGRGENRPKESPYSKFATAVRKTWSIVQPGCSNAVL